jgi:hypothetical protein
MKSVTRYFNFINLIWVTDITAALGFCANNTVYYMLYNFQCVLLCS